VSGRTVFLLAALCLACPRVWAQEAAPAQPPREEQPAPRSIPELIDALGVDDFSGMAASRELAERGAAAVPALVANLQSETPRARYWSIAALSGIGDERAVPAILALLDDPDATVRAVAVWHVSRWYDRPEVRNAVLGKLEDSSSFVQGYVLKVIQTRHDAEAVPQVRKMLASPEPEVRYDALHTLALVAGRDSLPAVRTALTEDESPLVRRCALQCCTIVEPRRPDCAELLILGLRDKDEQVRETAVRLLRRGFGQYFGFDPAAEPMEREPAVREWRQWYEQNAARLRWDERNRRFEAPTAGAADGAGPPGPRAQ
jgi:HEAT repeat protein